jgi:hypothetical protein
VLEANLGTTRKMAEHFNNMLESVIKRVTALDEPTNVDTTADDNVAGVAALGA